MLMRFMGTIHLEMVQSQIGAVIDEVMMLFWYAVGLETLC